VEAASVPWRPLGELFVSRGLISEAELETALAEQAATGKRLGEILVDRGLVSGPDLTSALMDQLGVEISKEEGFGSGLWAEIKKRHRRGVKSDEDDVTPITALRPVETEPQPEEPEYDLEPEPEPEPEPYAPPPAAHVEVEPEPEAAFEQEPELEEELQEELEEILAEYEPPAPIEHEPLVATLAAPEPEVAEPEFAEPEPPVHEDDAPVDWAEPEPAPIVAVEPDPEPQPDPAPAADESPAALGESGGTAELRAELDDARTDLAQLQEMLADAMAALSALTSDAPVEPYSD
jgi:hypothetical protein